MYEPRLAQQWRKRADELRVLADGGQTRAIQETFSRLADDLERMAAQAERAEHAHRGTRARRVAGVSG